MSSPEQICDDLELAKRIVKKQLDKEMVSGVLLIVVGRNFEKDKEHIFCMTGGDNGCIVAAIKEVLRPTDHTEGSDLALYQETATDSLAADDRRKEDERED